MILIPAVQCVGAADAKMPISVTKQNKIYLWLDDKKITTSYVLGKKKKKRKKKSNVFTL